MSASLITDVDQVEDLYPKSGDQILYYGRDIFEKGVQVLTHGYRYSVMWADPFPFSGILQIFSADDGLPFRAPLINFSLLEKK